MAHQNRVKLSLSLSILNLPEGGVGGQRHDPATLPCGKFFFIWHYTKTIGFGGLGVACWPLVAKFAGSNPAEAVGFLGQKKSSARLPSEGK